MKFAHSFWSKPLLCKKFNDLRVGLAVTLVDYALSVEFIHRNGYEIELYADKEGAYILSEIPYDKVHIIENTITDNYHFAASIKFEALKRMNLEDCLIDGDIFLSKGRVFSEIEKSNSDVTCSFFEGEHLVKNCEFADEMFEILCKYDFKYPYTVPIKNKCDGWYNTSIIKFGNQQLKDEYIKQYIEHVNKLKDIDFKNVWPDLIIEQRNLTQYCRANNLKINTILKDFPSKESYEYANLIGFNHLGSTKESFQNTFVKILASLNLELLQKINLFINIYETNYVHKTDEPS